MAIKQGQRIAGLSKIADILIITKGQLTNRNGNQMPPKAKSRISLISDSALIKYSQREILGASGSGSFAYQ
jgi:hypothetical protein